MAILGVEVFFVISGYLITLLLIGEHERTGRGRPRASSGCAAPAGLLPALYVMLAGLARLHHGVLPTVARVRPGATSWPACST